MGTPLSCGVMAVLLILFAHQEQQRAAVVILVIHASALIGVKSSALTD